MPITTPDSIYYADGTTVASLEAITSAMATSVQTALDFRQTHTFYWTTATSRSAQSGMLAGDTGYQADNGVTYIYNGATWLVWSKAQTSYTPTFTAFTASSATFTYSISGGVVTVTGKATCAATLPTGSIRFTTPADFNINTGPLGTVEAAIIGYGGLDDASTTNNYGLQVRVSSANQVALVAPTYTGAAAGVAYLTISTTSKDIPITWASGDVFYVTFSYPVA